MLLVVMNRRAVPEHPLPAGEGRCDARIAEIESFAEQSAARRGEGLSARVTFTGKQKTRQPGLPRLPAYD